MHKNPQSSFNYFNSKKFSRKLGEILEHCATNHDLFLLQILYRDNRKLFRIKYCQMIFPIGGPAFFSLPRIPAEAFSFVFFSFILNSLDGAAVAPPVYRKRDWIGAIERWPSNGLSSAKRSVANYIWTAASNAEVRQESVFDVCQRATKIKKDEHLCCSRFIVLFRDVFSCNLSNSSSRRVF